MTSIQVLVVHLVSDLTQGAYRADRNLCIESNDPPKEVEYER